MRPGRALGGLLELLLPAGCLACGCWLPEGVARSLLCVRCRSRLPVAPRPRCPRCDLPLGTGRRLEPTCRECRGWPSELTRARHVHVLEPPADALVHALKYEGWRELAREMGAAMARVAAPLSEAPIVVPVPTTRERLRRRGYNQSALLAGTVAADLGCEAVEALTRRAGGRTQVALHPSQRWANVQGVFVAAPNALRALAGRTAVLVDDVLTTGATASAASLALSEIGVREVLLVTYARALPRRGGDAR